MRNDNLLKVAELFNGIGAQHKALTRLGLPFEIVATSDIDKDSIVSYAAIHCGLTLEMVDTYDKYPSRSEMADYLLKLNVGYDFKENKPYDWHKLARRKSKEIEKYYLATIISKQVGDISLAADIPQADLWTYSFPCTDISAAGLQKGLSDDSGTRSSLVWQVKRLLLIAQEQDKLPNALLMENVKALVSNKFMLDFNLWLNSLESLGYKTFYEVINGKDCGVPQNRERVFAVSFLDNRSFEFPDKIPLLIRLKDVLEHNVDEKYYLSDEVTAKLLEQIENKEISNTVRGGGRASTDRHSWDLVRD